MKLIMALAMTVGVAACSDMGDSADTTYRDKALALVGDKDADLTSPDQALLAYFDWSNAEKEADCYWTAWSHQTANADDYADEKQATHQKFFAGQALEARESTAFDLERCLEDRMRTRIDVREVELETPSRAIVLANVKNVTPVGDSAELAESLREAREMGENFRYQMNLIDGVWKVSQIYRFSEYSDPQWQPYFDEDYGKNRNTWLAFPI